MTKKELIAEIAIEVHKPAKEVEEFLTAYIDVVTRCLSDGDKVQLVGFGTFETRDHSAREGRNIHTGETIQIAASKTVSFRAGKNLKECIKA